MITIHPAVISAHGITNTRRRNSLQSPHQALSPPPVRRSTSARRRTRRGILAQCGYCVIGVDCSPDGLAIAQARAEEAKVVVDWRCADVSALPVENLSVDFANDRGCFHVIADEDRPVYAREIARVMKPGGCFLLRGCRNVKDLPFNAITEEVVDKFFWNIFRAAVCPSGSSQMRGRWKRMWW